MNLWLYNNKHIIIVLCPIVFRETRRIYSWTFSSGRSSVVHAVKYRDYAIATVILQVIRIAL